MPACIRPKTLRAAARRLRTRLGDEDGLTIVEVAVSGLMVGLIALSLVGLDAAGRTAADQRWRAQAFQVAQADQERIKGLSADQIATLDQTRTVTLDGVPYAVTSSGQFLSSSSNAASCSSPAAAADYAKVVSTVDWSANARAPITVQSVITPRAGGSLITQTLDQDANPLGGVRINVVGADESTDTVRRFGSTDAGGCTIFGALLVGDYEVSPVLAGYVDRDGDSTPSSIVTTTAGNTTTVPFTLGQAGRVTASFQTTIGATTYPNQDAPSVSWFNSGMPSATNGFQTPGSPTSTITTPQTLFPFFVTTPGNYNGNYSVWAGRCLTAQPPTANRTLANVAPGVTDTLSGARAVAMPGMVVSVTYNGVPIKPTAIRLTDSCGQTWLPPIDPAATMPSTGWIDKPGQPYGTYSICAEHKWRSGSGPSNYRRVTMTNRANTNFTAANTTVIAITSSSSTGRC